MPDLNIYSGKQLTHLFEPGVWHAFCVKACNSHPIHFKRKRDQRFKKFIHSHMRANKRSKIREGGVQAASD